VTAADLRAGNLPAGEMVCVAGVATYNNPDTRNLVVQDGTGAIRLGGMSRPDLRQGTRVEVCGQTRGAQSGMTLARPDVTALGPGGFPPARRTSSDEWLAGRVDWQWIEVEGMAHAITLDRFGAMTMHMVVDGRRVRVRIDLTANHIARSPDGRTGPCPGRGQPGLGPFRRRGPAAAVSG
jgi:hypothetical protein